MNTLTRILAAFWVASAAQAQTGSPDWIEQARSVASSVPPRLLSVLQEEIARAGPEGAIDVCREQAPRMARAASEQSGWTVRRVSLRNRNPKAVPDAWERAALEDFDRRAAAGEPLPQLEKAERVTEDGKPVWRYMRALPVQPLCLQCHGPAGELSAAVKGQLSTHYPGDAATGYKLGDIRGAMTLRRPAP